jgi:3-oxoacyl-[acyl-carrier-protein] synthase-1
VFKTYEMKPVYLLNDHIITSLGIGTPACMEAVRRNETGIRLTDDPGLYPAPVMLSGVDNDAIAREFEALLDRYGKRAVASSFTRLEKMMIVSVHHAMAGTEVKPSSARTLLIISTTKGNVDLLEARFNATFPHQRIYLWEMARIIGSFFGFRNTPLIISNACISGVMAVMAATRYLSSGRYDHVVVSGGDIASEFVISGFQAFQSLSPGPCKPFDKERNGLSLGEGCGSLVLGISRDEVTGKAIRVAGAATSNDANHISGPSRTGEELGTAILNAMQEAGTTSGAIDFISAHGTATLFNDEMESKALAFAGLSEVPVNSFKGYWGHTLGAAGVIESVATLASMREGMLFRSAGCLEAGVPEPMNIIMEHRPAAITTALKTASGFGGCNAAIIYTND